MDPLFPVDSPASFFPGAMMAKPRGSGLLSVGMKNFSKAMGRRRSRLVVGRDIRTERRSKRLLVGRCVDRLTRKLDRFHNWSIRQR